MADLVALIDANVLFPISLCDTLLRCAQAGTYRPLWSAQILDEFVRNLAAQGRPTLERAQRRAAHMQRAFPHAMVGGYGDLVPQLTCDQGDRHVLAAAIRGDAQFIVTQNLADFPPASLRPHGIHTRHPDRFLLDLYDEDQEAVIEAIRSQAAALRNPTKTVAAVLDTLAVHVPAFVEQARSSVLTGG